MPHLKFQPGMLLHNAPAHENSLIDLADGFGCGCEPIKTPTIHTRTATTTADTNAADTPLVAFLFRVTGTNVKTGESLNIYFNEDKSAYAINITDTNALTALKARFEEMMSKYVGSGATNVTQPDLNEAGFVFTVKQETAKINFTGVVSSMGTNAFS